MVNVAQVAKVLKTVDEAADDAVEELFADGWDATSDDTLFR